MRDKEEVCFCRLVVLGVVVVAVIPSYRSFGLAWLQREREREREVGKVFFFLFFFSKRRAKACSAIFFSHSETLTVRERERERSHRVSNNLNVMVVGMVTYT